MRITNNIIQQTSVANVQRNLRDLYKAQTTVNTGLRLNKASDDPLGAAMSMETRSSIRALEQYRRGVDTATARSTAEENILDQLTGIMTRAKELGLQYSSDNVTQRQRQDAAIEFEELLLEAISLANTRSGEGYLFGGTGPDVKPYGTAIVAGNLDFTTTSPTGDVQIEVSDSHSVPANHSGVEVFEDTGLLAALRDMAIALKSGEQDQIEAAVTPIDTAFDGLQSLLGSVGARSSSLQITGANVEALKAGLQVLKSDIEDAELEVAITELLGRQTAYQAALMSNSRIVGMTLADYLR